jgi:hypothetical protein
VAASPANVKVVVNTGVVELTVEFLGVSLKTQNTLIRTQRLKEHQSFPMTTRPLW